MDDIYIAEAYLTTVYRFSEHSSGFKIPLRGVGGDFLVFYLQKFGCRPRANNPTVHSATIEILPSSCTSATLYPKIDR